MSRFNIGLQVWAAVKKYFGTCWFECVRGSSLICEGSIERSRQLTSICSDSTVATLVTSAAIDRSIGASCTVHLLLEKETLLTRRHTSDVCFSYHRWLSSQYLEHNIMAVSKDWVFNCGSASYKDVTGLKRSSEIWFVGQKMVKTGFNLREKVYINSLQTSRSAETVLISFVSTELKWVTHWLRYPISNNGTPVTAGLF